MPDAIDENIAALKTALQELDGIDLPELGTPPEVSAPLTNEIVAWTVRVYAYTVVCHFRELLRGVLLLVETDHVSAAFPCCRALFEVSAHSYYVKKHVVQHLKNKDLGSAWLFLSDVYLASRDLRERQKAGRAGFFQKLKSDYPEGPHIKRVMACFNEYFPDGQKEKPATIAYSALSEFSHPNFFAFNSHLCREVDPENLPTVKFGKPSRRWLKICLPAADMAVSAFLFTIGDLVRVVRDEELATAMFDALRAVIKTTEPASS